MTAHRPPIATLGGVGKNPDLNGHGFAISVELDNLTPNVEPGRRRKFVEKTHRICPYSNASRGSVEVKLTTVD